ncbi:PdxA family dehydrogenase [Noviherbaspirillum malthae]|jgi:4-hydroxy-L-threonine phosphate dehydrogenase PdxA|uniref:PdxA family dehydrogenase n=1 Tax=Noviherbaspirillum malthae TaxID=1260987 RepID=UPI00188EB713|nr:4-hydroxythreonine-4-phosphate dehydrogenase PdxA [Noviherbaspirillum malthae]
MKRIAITLGEPNGIGPEIAVKAAVELHGSVELVLVGDEYLVQQHAERYARQLRPVRFEPGAPVDGPALRFVDVPALPESAFRPGETLPEAGMAIVSYVRAAVGLAQQGLVDAVIGCPHSETAIHRAGIRFSGYPGLIAELTGTPEERVFLMLVSPELRIGHVTLHERLQGALDRINTQLVVDAAVAVIEATKALGIMQPKLGVFGINPHAGEDGLFGDDDQLITVPAVHRLREMGYAVDGPGGADLMLSQRRHDVYLAMYHDQGHIPIKLLSPLTASALSVGSGILFSSVGHGCAYDIAGKGVADPKATIRTARMLAGIAQ